MFSIICGLILSETAFVIAIQVSDPLTFTYNIFQGFIISSPPCYDKVCTFCSKSPKISLKTFHELSFRNWRGKLNKPPTFAILPSQPPPYSSLPPLPHAPKPLGTARFRRSEIVSKAASKRSFCVSCEARSQALPPGGTIFDGWHGCLGKDLQKMGGFHCPMKERTNYSSPWCQNQRKKVAGQRSFNVETYPNVWTEPWICLLQVVGQIHKNIPQMVGRFNDDVPW